MTTHPADNGNLDRPAIRLMAGGDILLTVDPAGQKRDSQAIFRNLRPLWADADVLVGNLECTLPGDGQTVTTEPRVVADEQLIHAVADAGFHVVSLANNHMFDCLEAGFDRTRDLLDELGVAWFGAGHNLAEAIRPAVIRSNGQSLAFVGGADRRSGPARFATDTGAGVRNIEESGVAEQVTALAAEHDHVIVCPHWGEERLRFPAPQQIELARGWIEAGASAVLGHHPHVIQGLEVHRGRPIAYSLGNLVASRVYFSDADVMDWNRLERTGCLVSMTLSPAGPTDIETIATFDDGHHVSPDPGRRGARRIASTSRHLARGVTLKRYRREYFRVKTLLPTLGHLRPSKLIRLRWRHVRNALALMTRGRAAE
jgi:poly-gamma-glutamate synthesis protein (capsule biosynthesis protein)